MVTAKASSTAVRSAARVGLAIVGAFVIGVVSFLAIRGDSEQEPAITYIHRDYLFDPAELEKLASFADDVVVVDVLRVEAIDPVRFRTRFAATVELSFKKVDYPAKEVYLAQDGGLFDTKQGPVEVRTDQTILATGSRYVVAIRYEDGKGYFNVLGGSHAVQLAGDDPTTGALWRVIESGGLPAVAEFAIGVRDPLTLIPDDPLAELATRQLDDSPSPADQIPNETEREWIATAEAYCVEFSDEKAMIRDILTKAYTAGSISQLEIAKIQKALDGARAGVEAITDSQERGDIRPSFEEIPIRVEEQLAALSDEAGALADMRDDVLRAAIDEIAARESAIEILWTEAAVTSCES